MAEGTVDLEELRRDLQVAMALNDVLGLSEEYSILRAAVDFNLVDIVQSLLDRGCPVNASVTDHDSPLHVAVGNGNYEIVELLLYNWADVNSRSENGETPLLIAVERDNLRIVELLLNYGADVNAEDNLDFLNALRWGNLQGATTPIYHYGEIGSPGLLGGCSLPWMAVDMNQADIVKMLLDSGAKRTVRDSPLHIAVGNGNYDMVELLLNRGADVHRKNKKSVTPLLRAVVRRHLRIVELLLKYGADVNAEDNMGLTPLHFHSSGECDPDFSAESEVVMLEIAKLLLNSGANVNAEMEYGYTPLHISIRSQLYSLADLLLNCNADFNLPYEDGFTALHMAAMNGNKKFVSDLLARGADVNAMSSDGKTALHIAISYNHEEVAEVLLAKGAIANCADDLGRFPLNCLGHELKVMGTLLLNWGADVNCKTEIGRTVLHTAARARKGELVEFLLENGALLNCKDVDGESPLHSADDRVVIHNLMKYGATVDSRSKNGRTPLHSLSSLCGSEAVAALLEFGADINIKCNRGLTPLDWTHHSSYNGLLIFENYESSYNSTRRTETRDVLLRHQAKMEAVGLHVEESQFSARYEGRLEEFKNSCQEEVLLLRSEFISGTIVSYHDIVRKDVRFSAKYMDNENVVQAAELEEYRSKFPLYGSMIKGQFQKGLARNKLLKRAKKILHRLIDLPDDCSDEIMDYLCDNDLAVLIDVEIQ